ncbi:MAG TPA: hypothetical protein VK906_02620 [Egicoccus sp.]|nr:hypothetical protein [Egicoccus sp.]HSK22037.1 hypothetical protein [Egicoccus sp.]
MPVATTKQGWEALPSDLRARVVAHVGAEVADAVTRQGGFTPGVAARLRFADGSRAFVKATAASLDPDSAVMHRREAAIAGRLDDPAIPRLLAVVDDGDWVALLFEHGDYHLGRWATFAASPERMQRHGLTVEDVERAAEATSDLGGHLAGDTLLHGDLRADQILVAGMRTSFVDWPHACIGAAWADLALMIPSMLAADRRLEVATVVSLSAELRAAPAPALRALLSAVTGHLLWQSDEPDPPGLPSVRAFQRAQGRALLPWVFAAVS